MEFGDVVDDLADEVFSHGLVGFVDECRYGLIVFSGADESRELGVSAGESMEASGPWKLFEGMMGDGDVDVHGSTARDRWDESDFVGVGEGSMVICVFAISGNADRGAAAT